MRVYLKDGTTIECEEFRAIDAGVLLFGPDESEDESAEDEDDDQLLANGFIPLSELTAVLSEEYIQQVEGAQQAPPQQQPPGQPQGRGQHEAGAVPGPDVPPRGQGRQ